MIASWRRRSVQQGRAWTTASRVVAARPPFDNSIQRGAAWMDLEWDREEDKDNDGRLAYG